MRQRGVSPTKAHCVLRNAYLFQPLRQVHDAPMIACRLRGKGDSGCIIVTTVISSRQSMQSSESRCVG
jgi:hypothetical protein